MWRCPRTRSRGRATHPSSRWLRACLPVRAAPAHRCSTKAGLMRSRPSTKFRSGRAGRIAPGSSAGSSRDSSTTSLKRRRTVVWLERKAGSDVAAVTSKDVKLSSRPGGEAGGRANGGRAGARMGAGRAAGARVGRRVERGPDGSWMRGGGWVHVHGWRIRGAASCPVLSGAGLPSAGAASGP
jgi:hypothetical protein